MSNIILDTKNVGKIKGLFYLPDYQRGYMTFMKVRESHIAYNQLL